MREPLDAQDVALVGYNWRRGIERREGRRWGGWIALTYTAGGEIAGILGHDGTEDGESAKDDRGDGLHFVG